MSGFESIGHESSPPLQYTAETEPLVMQYGDVYPFIVKVEFEFGRTRVSLSGELDIDAVISINIDELFNRFIDEENEKLILNLSGISFLDSSGLRALLTAESRCKNKGTDFRLQSPSEACTNIIEHGGLANHFVFEEDPEP